MAQVQELQTGLWAHFCQQNESLSLRLQGASATFTRMRAVSAMFATDQFDLKRKKKSIVVSHCLHQDSFCLSCTLGGNLLEKREGGFLDAVGNVP